MLLFAPYGYQKIRQGTENIELAELGKIEGSSSFIPVSWSQSIVEVCGEYNNSMWGGISRILCSDRNLYNKIIYIF